MGPTIVLVARGLRQRSIHAWTTVNLGTDTSRGDFFTNTVLLAIYERGRPAKTEVTVQSQVAEGMSDPLGKEVQPSAEREHLESRGKTIPQSTW